MTKLSGTGRGYEPTSKVWVLVYLVYLIGLVSLTMFFTVGWVFFF